MIKLGALIFLNLFSFGIQAFDAQGAGSGSGSGRGADAYSTAAHMAAFNAATFSATNKRKKSKKKKVKHVLRKCEWRGCSCGNKIFPTDQTFYGHVNSIDTRKHPTCQWEHCSFDTKNQGRISRAIHMRIHSGEKPFICKQCGHATNREYSLSRHMKTHAKDYTRKKPKPSIPPYKRNQEESYQLLKLEFGPKAYFFEEEESAHSKFLKENFAFIDRVIANQIIANGLDATDESISRGSTTNPSSDVAYMFLDACLNASGTKRPMPAITNPQLPKKRRLVATTNLEEFNHTTTPTDYDLLHAAANTALLRAVHTKSS